MVRAATHAPPALFGGTANLLNSSSGPEAFVVPDLIHGAALACSMVEALVAERDYSNVIRTILQRGAFVLKRPSTVIEIHYYESNMVQ